MGAAGFDWQAFIETEPVAVGGDPPGSPGTGGEGADWKAFLDTELTGSPFVPSGPSGTGADWVGFLQAEPDDELLWPESAGGPGSDWTGFLSAAFTGQPFEPSSPGSSEGGFDWGGFLFITPEGFVQFSPTVFGRLLMTVDNATGAVDLILPPQTGQEGRVLVTNGSTVSWGTFSSELGGTVTSIGLSAPDIFSVSNSPVSVAGTIALGLVAQDANTIWAGPATGAAATPSFRALVAGDIPDLSGTYQPKDADLTAIAALATDAFGRVLLTKTSDAAVRSYIGAGTSSFSGAYADLTGLPDLTVYQTKTGTLALGGFSSITGTVPIANIPTGTSGSTVALGNHTHTFASLTSTPTTLSGYGITDAQPLDADLTSWAAVTRASGFDTFTATPTLANLKALLTDETAVGWNLLTLANPTAIRFLRINADNTVDALSDTDFRTAIGAGTGGGSVTSFSAGDLSPLFTTSEATVTTTPALTFALSNAAAHTIFGNFTGSAAAPSYNVLGTGVDTALGVNVGSAGAFVTFNGALGTPSSGTLTNYTFPTLNQNTSGSAASLSISGQTGLLTFTGLASTSRVKTVLDAADTILELGGSYTPTGTWTNMTLVTPALGTPASGVVTNLTGTASININGTVGATTPSTGVFTTLVAGSTTSLLLGTAGSAVGNIGFRNATSGTVTLAPPTGALGTYTITLPNAASTMPVFPQQITFTGPTAARTVTFPDANFTVARTDAANTFTGHQTIEGVTSTGATGTGKFVFDTSPTLTNLTLTGTSTSITNVGTFALRDTSAAFDVTLAATSSTALTAGRTLTLDVANAARTLKLTGNPTLADWFDQSVKTTASPTFSVVTATGSNGLNLTHATSAYIVGNWTNTGGQGGYSFQENGVQQGAFQMNGSAFTTTARQLWMEFVNTSSGGISFWTNTTQRLDINNDGTLRARAYTAGEIISDGSGNLTSAGAAATAATTGTMTVTMTKSVHTITPTGACTFNASGGVAGQRCTFYITTSGVSSFVLTWGTNFKTTGTLATGTTTAKVFTVSFVCNDGTTWAETGRTTAM